MKINCLSCGHNVEISEAYDDYTGVIKCFACQALLEIKAENGYLHSVQLANNLSAAPPGLSGFTEPSDAPEQTGESSSET